MRRAKVVELPLVPGALSDDTELAAKLQATNMDKVRFRGNRAETISGWEAFNASGLTAGTARGVHQWSTLTGLPVVLAASETAVNAWMDGTRLTITPKWADVFLTPGCFIWGAGTNPTVTVTWNVYNVATGLSEVAPHFLQVGDVITPSGHTDSALAFNTSFTITAIPTLTTFQFVGSGTAGGGSNNAGSAPFVVTVAFRAGLATGTGDAISTRPRIYSIDNFGENAVFCGSDGTPVFYWQPATSFPELISNGGFDSGTDWSEGTGWAEISGGKASHSGASSGDLQTSLNDALVGGKTYELTFTLASFATTASLLVAIDDDVSARVTIYPEITTADSGAANLTYSCRFVCPAHATLLIFTAEGTLDLDNVSIKLPSIAAAINEAPTKNYALFVDGNHVLHVLGSVEQDGDFNPLLHRWCDQDNYREWITDTDNIAGEQTLGKGSYAVCGAQVGGQNLILSDDGAFVSSFTDNGYNLQQIGQGCGAIGARALSVLNSRAFWASANGVHAFDGAQVLTIECPLKDRYVGQLEQYQENKTFSWINAEYGEWWLHYAHDDDGTEVSRYLVFNFVEKGNPWSFGTLNRTCMVRASAFQHPIGIDASDNIWLHEKGLVFSGSGIVLPFIETGYVTADTGDRWFGCRRYIPDVKDQTGNIEFSITAKRSPQGQNTTQTLGPLVLMPDAPKLDFLIVGRQLKFRWESANSTTQWRLGVVGLEMVTERERQ